MLMFGACFYFYRTSINLSIHRTETESCVSAFAASLAGHDLTYAFQEYFHSKRIQNARSVGSRAQRGDPDSPVLSTNEDNVPEPTLSKDEFASIIYSVTGVRPPQDHIDTVFDLVDTDHSGSMSFNEFLAFFGAHPCHKGGF